MHTIVILITGILALTSATTYNFTDCLNGESFVENLRTANGQCKSCNPGFYLSFSENIEMTKDCNICNFVLNARNKKCHECQNNYYCTGGAIEPIHKTTQCLFGKSLRLNTNSSVDNSCKDITPPVITTSNKPTILDYLSPFNYTENVSCFDTVDSSLPVKYYGNLDMNKPGKYNVTYECVDTSSNVVSKQITVIVRDKFADIELLYNSFCCSKNHNTVLPSSNLTCYSLLQLYRNARGCSLSYRDYTQIRNVSIPHIVLG